MTEVLANTDMLLLMLANGIIPRLPEVEMPDEFLDAHSDFTRVTGNDNDIIDIVYDRDEEVQCIEISDPEHLYLTDGYIPTHNTANIVFLKSPDDTLLETLSKMSGTRHVSYADSKTVNIDKNRIVSQVDERTSINITTKEVPLLSYNDLANMPKGNSAIFRIGGSPIWNRNQMALPMSYCMYKDPVNFSGKKFTLLSVPTTSSALEFDLMNMIPDFDKMLEQRLLEYETLDDAMYAYKQSNGLTDADFSKMDSDVLATEIMNEVRAIIKQRQEEEKKSKKKKANVNLKMTENKELKKALEQEQVKHEDGQKKRYACGKLSREDIIRAGNGYSDIFYDAFIMTRDEWKSSPLVIYTEDSVRVNTSASGSRDFDGNDVLIDFNDKEIQKYGEKMVQQATDANDSRVFTEDAGTKLSSISIKPTFVQWLCSLDAWPKFFDEAVAKRLDQ